MEPPDAADITTFEAVFAERWLPMVRLAALTTGSLAIAEEITQDAFTQLYRRWDTVTQPKAWLRVAVINGCRDWTRRQVLERRHAHATSEIVAADESIAMLKALDALNHRQRAAVILRFYEDLPEQDIAAALGCRPGTVKSMLSRALSTLRKELNP